MERFKTIDVPGLGVCTVSICEGAGVGTFPASVNLWGVIAGVYGGVNDPAAHGFWRDVRGSFHTFDVPGSISTFVTSINLWGQIAGNFYDSNGVSRGYVLIAQ
jgi:hypothetical protein